MTDIFKNKNEIDTREKIFSMSETLEEMKKKGPAPTKTINIVTRRRLTDREIIMCKSVFKDSIDYKKIWIVMGGFVQSLSGNAITPFGYIITLPRKDYIENKDFTIARPELKHWFIHEVTHVWQNVLGFQGMNKVKRVCRGEYFKTVSSPDASRGEDISPYATDLSGRDLYKKFNEFNYEQQGRIIELYFDAKFLKYSDPHRAHHQLSLKLERHVLFTLKEFLENPNNKSLLPKS
ncbi:MULTISPECIES: hypothetical protein [Acinetobacter calcoaceticus/baumannii complex]|uniref:hypothetical protein n=1 Tax=Acinetobacter calcoaceticus/baumannii complex TaxID=909768 RepID=UPI0019517E7D|nr:hypothetical protein [Acinetobacter pittii]MCG5226638.1 hypothetical protein [Acinetobacter pittii]QRQ14784.1 hypothetical protein I6J46_08975 [Acinetobacter pittii]